MPNDEQMDAGDPLSDSDFASLRKLGGGAARTRDIPFPPSLPPERQAAYRAFAEHFPEVADTTPDPDKPDVPRGLRVYNAIFGADPSTGRRAMPPEQSMALHEKLFGVPYYAQPTPIAGGRTAEGGAPPRRATMGEVAGLAASRGIANAPIVGRIGRQAMRLAGGAIPQGEDLPFAEGTTTTLPQRLVGGAIEGAVGMTDPSMSLPLALSGGTSALGSLGLLAGGAAAGELVRPGSAGLGQRARRAGIAAATMAPIAGLGAIGRGVAGRLTASEIGRGAGALAGEVLGGGLGSAGAAALEGAPLGELPEAAAHGAVGIGLFGLGTRTLRQMKVRGVNAETLRALRGAKMKENATRPDGTREVPILGTDDAAVIDEARTRWEAVAPEIARATGIDVDRYTEIVIDPTVTTGWDVRPDAARGRYVVRINPDALTGDVFTPQRTFEHTAHEAAHIAQYEAARTQGGRLRTEGDVHRWWDGIVDRIAGSPIPEAGVGLARMEGQATRLGGRAMRPGIETLLPLTPEEEAEIAAAHGSATALGGETAQPEGRPIASGPAGEPVSGAVGGTPHDRFVAMSERLNLVKEELKAAIAAVKVAKTPLERVQIEGQIRSIRERIRMGSQAIARIQEQMGTPEEARGVGQTAQEMGRAEELARADAAEARDIEIDRGMRAAYEETGEAGPRPGGQLALPPPAPSYGGRTTLREMAIDSALEEAGARHPIGRARRFEVPTGATPAAVGRRALPAPAGEQVGQVLPTRTQEIIRARRVAPEAELREMNRPIQSMGRQMIEQVQRGMAEGAIEPAEGAAAIAKVERLMKEAHDIHAPVGGHVATREELIHIRQRLEQLYAEGRESIFRAPTGRRIEGGHSAQLSPEEAYKFALAHKTQWQRENPGRLYPRVLEQRLTDARIHRRDALGMNPNRDEIAGGATLERAGIGAQDRAGVLREIAGVGGHEAQLSRKEKARLDAATEGKEPWQLTRAEFVKREGVGKTGKAAKAMTSEPPNYGMTRLIYGREELVSVKPSANAITLPSGWSGTSAMTTWRGSGGKTIRILALNEPGRKPITAEALGGIGSAESPELRGLGFVNGGALVRDGKLLDMWVQDDLRNTGLAGAIMREAMIHAPNGAAGPFSSDKLANLAHHMTIRKAIETGKSVPPEVLADYPDLAAKSTKSSGHAAQLSREEQARFDASTAGASSPDEVARAHAAWLSQGTNSPWFKRWFGESKVVDEGGKPMVAYHGTRSSGVVKPFDTFNTAESDFGAHFTTEPAVASMFATEGAVYPTYLRINNPLRMRDMGYWTEKSILAQLQEKGLITPDRAETVRGEVAKASYKPGARNAVLVRLLKSLGFDGVVYLNRREIVGRGETAMPADRWARAVEMDPRSDAEFKKAIPEASDAYIAFDPTQIKSSTGNRGTFEPANPAIHQAQLSAEEAGRFMRDNGIRKGTPAERAEGRLDGPLDWLGQVLDGVRNLSRYITGAGVQLELAAAGKRGSPAAAKGLGQITDAEQQKAYLQALIDRKAIELGRNLPGGARHLQIADPKFEQHPKFLKLTDAQQAKVRDAAAKWREFWNTEVAPLAVASGLKVRVERAGKVTYEPIDQHLMDAYWRHVWSRDLIRQIGAGRGRIFDESVQAIIANHDAPDEAGARLILASGYLSRRGKLPQWASDIMRQTGRELPPPPDTPTMPTYEDLMARFAQKGLPTGDANRITWAALNERQLDLPAEAYEYGWENTGNELARNMARTIAGANAYGQAFEKLAPTLNELRLQKGDGAARALYESVRAQIQPKAAGPVAKVLRTMAAPITSLATTSIRSFWLKNILAGEYKLAATVGVGSYVGGLADTVRALGIRIGDRMLKRVPQWTLAETSGAIEAALPQDMGWLGWAVNKVPFYRGAEIPLREHSVNAWMREVVKLVPRFLENPTQKRGFAADAKWQLKSRLKLSDTDIHDLAAAMGGSPKLGVKAQVENLKTALPSLMRKMAYWAAESTQSIANARTLPQWATRPELAPFTIFQRMGFAGWTNDIKNVAIPLSKGNPIPLIKMVGGAALAGEAFAAMLHLALGKREPAEDQPTVTRILDNMAQIEIAQPFAFLMSPGQRTQTAEGIPIPTVFRAFFADSYANLFNQAYRLATGKETAGQTVEDLSRSMVGLYRDAIMAWEAQGKAPKFASDQARTRLRNAWIFSGNKPPSQTRPIAADYPYVRQIRAAFWTDDPAKWKQAVDSAMAFWQVRIAQDAEKAGKPMNAQRARVEAVRQALQHLDAEAPVPGGMPLADVQRALVQMGPDGRAEMSAAFRAYDERRQRFLRATGLPSPQMGGQRRQAILRGPQNVRAVPPSFMNAPAPPAP